MSAQVQAQGIRFPYGRTAVVAVIAFAIGVAGTFAIQQVVDRSSTVGTAAPYTLWDTGRLEAMEGRQAAASVTTAPALWDAGRLDTIEARQLAEGFLQSPVLWDAGRLEAMEGRQLAATVSSTPAGWDRGMLKAMEGRQLAAVEPVVWDSFMSEPTQSLIGELSHGQI